jgi:hypothetical protein
VVTGTDPAHPGVFSTEAIQDEKVGDRVLTRSQYDRNAPEEQGTVT